MAPLPPTNRKTPSKSTSTTFSNPYHRISKSPLKRAKLHTKHSALLSRITKTTPPTNSNSNSDPQKRRRRPSKKLVANLDALADALPATTATPHNATGTNNAETPPRSQRQQQQQEREEENRGSKKMQHKSLKSQRGAGKKKEKIVAMERERFARNLAEMARGGDGKMDVEGNGGEWEREGKKVESGSAERWAAIRGFIRERMERSVGGSG